MKQGRGLVGGLSIACLAVVIYFLMRTPVSADLTSLIHTTLEEFNAGSLYHTGLTRFQDGEVQLLVVGLSGEWITNTNANGLIPLARHAAVSHGDDILVIGGRDSANVGRREVYYTTIDPSDHNLADWQTTTPLPAATYPNGLFWHASTVVGDRVYVLGGGHTDDDTKVNTVSFAPINADGTLGAWQSTLALPEALSLLQAVTVNGRIYAFGGWDDAWSSRDEVYVGAVNESTGQVTSWTPTTVFPYPTLGHMANVAQGRIYGMGGVHPDPEIGGVSPYVYFATPDPDTGLISNWIRATDMSNNLYGSAAVSFAEVLFTTGGAINQLTNPSSYVGATLIEPNGSIWSWVDTSLLSPSRFFHAAVASDDGWLYVINGSDGERPINNVNRGATRGRAKNFAPSGNYTSPTIDLLRRSELIELSWNTTMTDTSKLAVTMRYRTKMTAGADWSDWSEAHSSSLVPGTVTTTISLDGMARFFQYEASLSTADITLTPILNAVELVYLPPIYSVDVDKSAQPAAGSIVYAGDVVSYTLEFTNSTTGITATNAYILDLVPQHMQYVAGSIWGTGAVDTNAPEMRWNLGTVGLGDTGQVGFAARVIEDFFQPVTVENGANFFSSDGPVQFSNFVTHTAKLRVPEMAVSKVASPPHGSQVLPGSQINYTISYWNPGIFDVQNAYLLDTYDERESYQVLSMLPEPPAGSDHLWQLGLVSPAGNGQIQVMVRITDTLPNHWVVRNDVTASGTGVIDPATDFITHEVVYSGVNLVDLRVDDIRWLPAAPQAGSQVAFYATITNQGTAPASGFFYTWLYIKPSPSTPPNGPADPIGSVCADAACTPPRYSFCAYLASLAVGASQEIAFMNLEADPVFPAAGTYDIYVQTDAAFTGEGYNKYWGRYAEDYEQNNTRHEILVIPDSGPPTIYMPLVVRRKD